MKGKRLPSWTHRRGHSGQWSVVPTATGQGAQAYDSGFVAWALPHDGCTQPGCTGKLVDDYCDICGTAVSAPDAVSAGTGRGSGNRGVSHLSRPACPDGNPSGGRGGSAAGSPPMSSLARRVATGFACWTPPPARRPSPFLLVIKA